MLFHDPGNNFCNDFTRNLKNIKILGNNFFQILEKP